MMPLRFAGAAAARCPPLRAPNTVGCVRAFADPAAGDTVARTGPGRQRQRGKGGSEPVGKGSLQEVQKHIQTVQARSQRAVEDGKTHQQETGKFSTNWRPEIKKVFRYPGDENPYEKKIGLPLRSRFRISPDPPNPKDKDDPTKARLFEEHKLQQEREGRYSNYAGLRFPTLETAENFDYHKDRGMNRVMERAYPIQVPGHRRLDPYLREYIHFLHNLDPVRFTLARIAQRYRLREGTVAKVVKEWSTNRYLTRSGLTRLQDKQVTREAVILAKKEAAYAKWAGWDQLGDKDDPETDDEAIGEYKGWRATNDWVRRQNVEVEMMSAFPMMEKRDAMPKRVDVDMVVDSKEHVKIINWIDPTDKVVF